MALIRKPGNGWKTNLSVLEFLYQSQLQVQKAISAYRSQGLGPLTLGRLKECAFQIRSLYLLQKL